MELLELLELLIVYVVIVKALLASFFFLLIFKKFLYLWELILGCFPGSSQDRVYLFVPPILLSILLQEQRGECEWLLVWGVLSGSNKLGNTIPKP